MRQLHLNGNRFESVPAPFIAALLSSLLDRVVVSHNPITTVPGALWDAQDEPNCPEIVWGAHPSLPLPVFLGHGDGKESAE